MPDSVFACGGAIPAAAIISLIFSFAISFFVRRAALLTGMVDIPRDTRRMHEDAVPLGGGAGMIIAFSTFLWIFSDGTDMSDYVSRLLPLCVLCGVYGLCDDKLALNVPSKLAFQSITAVLASLLLGSAEVFSLFGREYSLGIFSFPVTALGFVFMMNAVNLTDGADGLAAGTCAVSAASLCLIHLLRGDMGYAAFSASLCGACLGFMFHNVSPAKMFMGETGSAFLGFALAALSLPLLEKGACAPLPQLLLALMLPVSEAVSSFLRRLMGGRPPFSPDKEHMHHVLYGNGFSVPMICAVMYTFSLSCAAGAVLYRDFAPLSWAIMASAVAFIRAMLAKKPR